MNKQTTSDLMMVRPPIFLVILRQLIQINFKPLLEKDLNLKTLRDNALMEFENMLGILRENNLNVIDFDDDLSLKNSTLYFLIIG